MSRLAEMRNQISESYDQIRKHGKALDNSLTDLDRLFADLDKLANPVSYSTLQGPDPVQIPTTNCMAEVVIEDTDPNGNRQNAFREYAPRFQGDTKFWLHYLIDGKEISQATPAGNTIAEARKYADEQLSLEQVAVWDKRSKTPCMIIPEELTYPR